MIITTILAWFFIGAAFGALVGVVFKGDGFGLVGNIAVGVVGAIFGGRLVLVLGFESILVAMVGAAIGALSLLLLLRSVRLAALADDSTIVEAPVAYGSQSAANEFLVPSDTSNRPAHAPAELEGV